MLRILSNARFAFRAVGLRYAVRYFLTTIWRTA